MTDEYLDPLPGDFDDELEDVEPDDVQVVESSEERHPIMQLHDRDENA